MKGKDENAAPVDLCLEVLRRLDKAGVLEDLILIGSWCTHFYKAYFGGKAQLSALRTRKRRSEERPSNWLPKEVFRVSRFAGCEITAWTARRRGRYAIEVDARPPSVRYFSAVA